MALTTLQRLQAQLSIANAQVTVLTGQYQLAQDRLNAQITNLQSQIAALTPPTNANANTTGS
jgi:hypothetical protein